jgi:hypothetical protein
MQRNDRFSCTSGTHYPGWPIEIAVDKFALGWM